MNSAAFRAILVLSATDNMSRTVNAAIGNAQTRMARFGASAQNVGKDMMMRGGIIAAPIAAVVKSAIEYESAFAGVRKTWRGAESDLQKISKGIVDMSKEIPSTANELSAIAEQAGQLGIEANSVLKFTRTIADLGATTNLGEDAAPSFAKFANITRMPQQNFDRLASTVVDLGNNMATTEADIVAFGMRIAGAGAQVDIPQAKIMGLAAGLSSVGIEAEAGGTAISKTLIELKNRSMTGGAALDEVAKIAGMSGAAFKQAFTTDAAGATVTFIEGLGKIKQSGGNVFAVLDKLDMSEVRLRDTLLRASGAGDLLRKSLNLSSAAWEENTALTKEAEERYKTTASQLAIANNNITALRIQVGTMLLPVLRDLVSWTVDVTKSISSWVTENPKLTQAITLGTTALGAFLIVIGAASYVIGSITTIVGGMSAAYVWLTTSTTAATVATWLKTVATNIATVAELAFWSAVVLTGGAVGGLAMGLSWLASKTGIATAAQWLLNLAMDANPIGAVIIAVVGLGAAVAAMIVYWEELSAWFTSMPTWAQVAIVAVTAIAAPFLLVAAGIAYVVNNWSSLTSSIGSGVSFVIAYFINLKNSAIQMLGSIWEYVASIPSRMFEAGANIAKSIGEGIASAAAYPIDAINNVVGAVRDFLPFSPAKTGPLRDIHRVQIMETIAQGMSPKPMVQAMQQATGQTMGVINSPGKAAPSMNPTRSSGGGSVVVNFAPNVTVNGGGDADSIRKAVMEMGPEMVAYLKRSIASEMRTVMG